MVVVVDGCDVDTFSGLVGRAFAADGCYFEALVEKSVDNEFSYLAACLMGVDKLRCKISGVPETLTPTMATFLMRFLDSAAIFDRTVQFYSM